MKVASLHVGINKYGSRSLDLRGCVSDLAPIQDFLKRQLGLQEKNTIVLTDRQATRQYILNGLDWLASHEADVAVFQFSGHGTRVRDEQADELTGYDQAIVPVDFKRAGLILDDDLQRAFRKFPAKTRIVAIFDSCYSDRADRGILNAIKRVAKNRKNKVLPSSALTAGVIDQTYRGRGIAAPLAARDIILLSGCRDYETSADAYFGSKVGYRGAFTYSLQRALGTLERSGTYFSVLGLARDLCAAQGFEQQPQLSGPADWLKLPIFT